VETGRGGHYSDLLVAGEGGATTSRTAQRLDNLLLGNNGDADANSRLSITLETVAAPILQGK
jgi:hypothetical protein